MSSEINGLCLCEHYIPKELLTLILSHVPPAALTRLALVCEAWNTVIKDGLFWQMIFKRKYPKREAKDLPWYVYYALLSTDFFDTDLIRKHDWKSLAVWEFHRGPFKIKSWQYGCIKIEDEYFINLKAREVYTKILKKYKPDILIEATDDLRHVDIVMIGTETGIRSYRGTDLKKVDGTKSQINYIIDDYPDDVEQISVFLEVDTGPPCSLKILFDSIRHT